MVSLDDLKELVMYKRQFYLPIDHKDKRHGSAIMLMTPSFQSSKMAMAAPYMVNRRYFESYFIEKATERLIYNESVYPAHDYGEYINEEAMTTAQRNRLSDDEFGIPKYRRYPLNDEEHILLAIRFFNRIEEKFEKELASNIIKKVKEHDMADKVHVGNKNRFKPYWEKSGLAKLNESTDAGPLSEEVLSFSDHQYLLEFVDPDAVYNAARKFTPPIRVYFDGYTDHIKAVKPYFKADSIDKCFDRLRKKAPSRKVHVICCADPDNTKEEFEIDTVLVYTKDALAKKYPIFDYHKYLDYILQLYAIYSLSLKETGKKVYSSMAEPAAILLSGIADDQIAKRDTNDAFTVERFFKQIIDEYGIEHFVKILINGDTYLLFQYAKKYGKTRFQERNFFAEMDLMTEEADLVRSINEAEDSSSQDDDEILASDKKAEMPDLSDPMPKSIKKLQNMGTKLKRRIKQHSAYKLNKIARDMNRGNVGVESRDVNSLELLQSGVPNVSTSLESFNQMTGGDYVTDGKHVYLFESDKYDIILRNALFKDRFKTNKQILDFYRNVRNEVPFIKYTFVDLTRYANRNVFVDLSYYNESFFRNMADLNPDDKSNTIRIFNIYMELMERLLKDDKYKSYGKRTVFIPVLDWRHNNSSKMWIYKQDINPISAIYHYMRTNPNALKRIFGDKDVVFLGGKNYFKVNFSNTEFNGTGTNMVKFLKLIKRLIELGKFGEDPDAEGMEDSPRGIAMDIIDKVERSQNVTIDDVSKLDGLNKEVELISNKEVPTPGVASDIAVKKDPVDISADKLTGEIKTVPTNSKMQVTIPNARGKIVPMTTTVQVGKKLVSKASVKASTSVPSDTRAVNTISEKDRKDAIVDQVAKVANKATSSDQAMDRLDNDAFKQLVISLHQDSEDNVRVDRTRASAVIATEEEFHKKEVAGKTVKDILSEDKADEQLQTTSLNIASINEDWKHLTFVNFDKGYEPSDDIVKMLDSMQHWTFPIAVKNIGIQDNSTSDDIVDLWTIDCVDYKGTKFTLKVDIPKFINGSNFLKLRGNEKVLMIQSALLPIIKTGLAECQIIGSGGYNKIFVRRFGGRKGQSNPASSAIIRTLNRLMKNNSSTIKVVAGDNTKVCTKYELPIDYIDLAQVLNSVESSTSDLKLYFNQDELRQDYVVDDTKGIPIGVKNSINDGKAVKSIVYYDGTIGVTMSNFIATLLCENEEFSKIYNKIPVAGATYTYSKASILNAKIPVVVVCSYLEGLIATMNKAGVKYEFVQDLPKGAKMSDSTDYIEFSDGYLMYEVNYSSAMLMNGLKDCDTETYSIKDVNNRKMYMDFLESFGGGLKANGLENSYDCMLDPITKEILAKFKLPTDYVSVLIYASNILADNKYVKHIDQAGRRWRRKELIAGYFYKALTTSYQTYADANRRSRKATKMTMKQSAIIDLIVSKDPATSDLSVNNVINDVECINSVTNKGLVGMNVPRGYTISTRGYDDSMLNLFGMDTGFSGNVGINRQATINANVEGGRGFVKTIDGDSDKLSAAASFTMTEAVTPLGSTHDDPPRTLMTYVQTSKHMVRCDNNDPMLVTTGADEAMPYVASDIFAYKAKDDGKVVEVVNEGFGKNNYIVVEYKSGAHEIINLSEEIKKNSDGGYFVPLKLDTDYKVGQSFKAGEILAYDKLSFSKSLGESGNLAANIGTLAKVAIINTDEGFEDSAAVTEEFANKIGTFVIQGIETKVDCGSNIFINKQVGDSVMEGDTLFSFQEDFDDDVVNTLLRNLTIDTNQISELGHKPIKSKYTGIVDHIEIFRTCNDESMSPSLRALVKQYESKVQSFKDVYDKYGVDSSNLPKIGKVPEVGKAKNLDNSVMIIYYIKFNDRLSVGDKIVFYSANKGVIKYIIPKGEEPYTSFRPDEHVDSFMSLSSISGRMTCSIPLFAATSKLMVELDRSVKEIAGIPYDESKL